ncbi:MAG TPA: ABC-type transport auxiliary lipoprotein family protein [Candidatus Cloacimonadota bacterium]|nr:ABC-type transport auxiliary lipoprotein family protein [Candidatus Cloacimonadota bacterium]HQL15023.1 ABC-type transport auxiliary lipoprotein family protein [Candidatus Cloacimonadota bacterium]
MKKFVCPVLLLSLVVLCLISSACSFMNKRTVPVMNYYILDYLPATENPALYREKPFDKTLEVFDTTLPRTYDRNQIVRKLSYMQIAYFPNDLWSTRLYDAVPNLLVRRLSAYNIFRDVSRDLGETKPDFFLESYIQNIEYVEAAQPYAFLRMEMVLKNAKSQAVIFSLRDERSKILYDNSVAYLVQAFNEMIMAETDLFAQKCTQYLSGQPLETSPAFRATAKVNEQHYTQEEISAPETNMNTGELKVPLLMQSEMPIPFFAAYQDTTEIENKEVTGIMNEVLTLPIGKWKIDLSSDQDISANVEIKPSMRTVVTPFWSELIVRIIDQSQTRVRMRYDIYAKTPGQDAYDRKINSRYSPADEVGEYDYLWVMRPGTYLITVNGASPNAYKDFTTVSLEEAKSYILTVVVDPTGSNSVLVGAGLLESPVTKGHTRIHKGAVHANINFASNNSVSKNNPTTSISLSGEFDNKLDYDVWPVHYTTRSLYDLGFDKTTGTDFRINLDDYSLKNALMFYPWKENVFLRNFGLYGRADINTHFFDEYAFFTDNKNFVKLPQDADSVVITETKKLQVKDPFYPIRLKEGLGLTYRINFSSNASVNLRSGFGWQQDYEDKVYYFTGTRRIDGIDYDYYKENPSTTTQGIENSVIIDINNLLSFISLNSTLDVLFPLGATEKSTKYENENLVNIKLFRNISLDFKATVKYNKAVRDYVQTDYSAFLRLSLYY